MTDLTMTTFLQRLSNSRVMKQRRRRSFLSYGAREIQPSADMSFRGSLARKNIRVDFNTCRPLGEPVIRQPSPTTSSMYSDKHDSFISESSTDSNDLAALLKLPEMSMLLRGRANPRRNLNVQGVLVRLTDERFPEIISGVPHLRTTWTYNMVDLYKYDVDDDILRLAMGQTPIAVCNHLVARAPDGYGETSLFNNGPARQADEDCIPDDGYRLSVQCKSCEATYSVEVASTCSPQWDGTFEPYLQINSWRPI